MEDVMELVRKGGAFKTGVDISSNQGDVLLGKNILVNRFSTLYRLKRLGITRIPFDPASEGSIWDGTGNKINLYDGSALTGLFSPVKPALSLSNVESQVKEIREMRETALQLQSRAKEQMIRVVNDLKTGENRFDVQPLIEIVREILFLTEKNDNLFSFLSSEVGSRQSDYLVLHSINVCAIGASVLKKFQEQFGQIVNNSLRTFKEDQDDSVDHCSFLYYQTSEMHEIVLGYLLRDIGSFILPEGILFKRGTLSEEEYELIKSHSYQQGHRLLQKNHLTGAMLDNIICYHHAPLYLREDRSYPIDISPVEIPPYVKICRLVDMFCAMTSKRSYQEAVNPVSVVTEVVRRYSNKDPFLQLILATFLKVVGIYPPGSVVHLCNGQLAYVMDSNGPIVLPITDYFLHPLQSQQDPVDLSAATSEGLLLNVDRRKPLLSPADYQKILPDFLK
jgi:HD-GYP domain-containing protein (c-di-GMP phosphodiesterase class II)